VEDESQMRPLLPVIRAAGLDPSLSMQLSTWMARGSRELKMNIIGTISELGDAAGGPALRMAVLDDDEDVSLAAVEALETIRFTSAGPLLVRAAQIRRKQHPGHERFLAAVCRLLGEWGQPESVPFLMESAQKRSFLSLPGSSPALPVRIAAIHALGQFDSPEVWTFIEKLSQERTPELQEALHEVIERRTGSL